jgi:hypothetical protein
MEASMHGSFDRSPKKGADESIYRSWGIGFLALPVTVVIALAGLAIAQPTVSNLIAEAAQAEFAGSVMMPDPAPTQPAQPAGEIRAVKAN